MKINRICSLLFATFFFAAAFLFVFTPVQAEAATDDSYWIDALAYGGFEENASSKYGVTTYWQPKPGNSTAKVVLPRMMTVAYVDMIIYTGGGWWPVGLTIGAFGNTLNVLRYGPYENYWRVYGPVTTSLAQYNRVEINVYNPTSSDMYFDLLQCRVSSSAPYSDVGCNWSIYQDNFTQSSTFPAYNAADWRGYDEPGNLRLELSYDRWLKYQHIDIMLLLDVSHIDGITACLVNDQGYIPVSYQYLNNGEQEDSFNMLSISLDLTNVQPANTALRIYFTFHTEANSYNNFILYSIHGWSSTFAPTDSAFWFPKLIQAIKDSFSSMYQPPAGATPPAVSDQMQSGQDFVQDGIGQVDQELDVIATIPRPDLGSIDLPSDHLDSIDYNTNVAHLTMLTHSQPFRLIFFFAALFMVVGVVVYGRRG